MIFSLAEDLPSRDYPLIRRHSWAQARGERGARLGELVNLKVEAAPAGKPFEIDEGAR